MLVATAGVRLKPACARTSFSPPQVGTTGGPTEASEPLTSRRALRADVGVDHEMTRQRAAIRMSGKLTVADAIARRRKWSCPAQHERLSIRVSALDLDERPKRPQR
jgi:hypothetical protein